MGAGERFEGGLVCALPLRVPGDARPGYDAKDVEAENAFGQAFFVGLAGIGVFDDVLGEPLRKAIFGDGLLFVRKRGAASFYHAGEVAKRLLMGVERVFARGIQIVDARFESFLGKDSESIQIVLRGRYGNADGGKYASVYVRGRSGGHGDAAVAARDTREFVERFVEVGDGHGARGYSDVYHIVR